MGWKIAAQSAGFGSAPSPAAGRAGEGGSGGTFWSWQRFALHRRRSLGQNEGSRNESRATFLLERSLPRSSEKLWLPAWFPASSSAAPRCRGRGPRAVVQLGVPSSPVKGGRGALLPFLRVDKWPAIECCRADGREDGALVQALRPCLPWAGCPCSVTPWGARKHAEMSNPLRSS